MSLLLCNYTPTPPYTQDATDFHFYAVSCFLFSAALFFLHFLPFLHAPCSIKAQVLLADLQTQAGLSMFTPQSYETKQKNVGGSAARSSGPIPANAACVVEMCISFLAGSACWAPAFRTQQHRINLTLALSGLRAGSLHNTYMKMAFSRLVQLR